MAIASLVLGIIGLTIVSLNYFTLFYPGMEFVIIPIGLFLSLPGLITGNRRRLAVAGISINAIAMLMSIIFHVPLFWW